MTNKHLNFITALLLILIGSILTTQVIQKIESEKSLYSNDTIVFGAIQSKDTASSYSPNRGSSIAYHITAKFTFGSNVYTQIFSVSKKYFDDSEIGQEVSILIDQSNPLNSRIEFSPNEDQGSFFWLKTFGIFSIFLIAIGIILVGSSLKSGNQV